MLLAAGSNPDQILGGTETEREENWTLLEVNLVVDVSLTSFVRKPKLFTLDVSSIESMSSSCIILLTIQYPNTPQHRICIKLFCYFLKLRIKMSLV